MNSIQICYQDRDLVVINKPAGVVVNRADSFTGETLQDWFTEEYLSKRQLAKSDWQDLVPTEFHDQYGSPQEIFAERKGMVHRLDKDTSGALVLAKNPGALVNLLHQFQTRQIMKEYTCLVHGVMKLKQSEVVAPLVRQDKRFMVKIEGRPAVTKYQVVAEYSGFDQDKLTANLARRGVSESHRAMFFKKAGQYQKFSLVKCWPQTGRTHQIRVHLKFAGHPLVGDQLYLGKKRARLDRLWCSRQFLHAQSIEFTHPRTGKKLKVEAELSSDLKQVLAELT